MERSTFMGLTSARLAPILMRSRITPWARSSGVKFIGRHCERALTMLRDLRCLNLASSVSLSVDTQNNNKQRKGQGIEVRVQRLKGSGIKVSIVQLMWVPEDVDEES